MSSRNGHGRDVVLSLCFMTWEDAHLRGMHFPPDRLIRALIDAPQVRRLLIADPFRDRVRTVAKTALGRITDPSVDSDPSRVAHLRPLRLHGRRNPTAIPALETLYRRYDDRLRAAAERAGLERPAVITTSPFVAGYAPLEWAGPVTYYVWDDWAAHPSFAAWWPAFQEGYDRVRVRGRRMCAVSDAILDRARPSGPARLIPNGVDPAEWTSFAPAADWYASLPRPLMLYAGTLDSRIDVDMVQRTARRFADGSLVLVGLNPDPAHLAPLQGLPNVHVRPPVTRPEVTAMIRAADVCLVPHATTDLTVAMSPLKLYEYVAAGRPVAAVDLPPMRDIDRRVVLCPAGEDYTDAVAQALALGPAPESERLAFVDRHSWHRRHDEILDLALG
jgi:teichuronic acid biosynthesis glycosyltransferase TuaH